MVEPGSQLTMLPGEVLSEIRDLCDPTENAQLTAERSTFDELRRELDAAVDGHFGDLVKKVATPIAELQGRTHCTICEARRILLNSFAKLKVKHGLLRASVITKELWGLSNDPTLMLEKLKEYIA